MGTLKFQVSSRKSISDLIKEKDNVIRGLGWMVTKRLNDKEIMEYQVNSSKNTNGSIRVKVDKIAWAEMMISSERWNFRWLKSFGDRMRSFGMR